jgi:glutamine synthetase
VTLCIPTGFVSWTGEALDTKIPLLRSMEALSKQAMRILRLFGTDTGVSRVSTTVGPEQEYFLVDKALFRRPDLVTCERTLFGARPPKGQQLEDHYFGAIPPRVLAFMAEVETELYRSACRSRRATTRWPRASTRSPRSSRPHIASDHQMLLMETLRRVAQRHGLKAILHEKPFAGVNGSGKHNNWSMATDTGVNLLDPQDETHTNLQFLVFLCAVIRAVDLHADLLRACDRLGRQRPPPRRQRGAAGHHLDLPRRHADGHAGQVEKGLPKRTLKGGVIDLGARALPQIPAALRRPQPHLALRLHRQQVRVPRGGAPHSSPGRTRCSTRSSRSRSTTWPPTLEKAVGKNATAAKLQAAALGLLQGIVKEHKRVVLRGRRLSPAWHKEARSAACRTWRTRWRPSRCSSAKKSVDLFKKYGVLSKAEVDSRTHITVEKWVKQLDIEADSMIAVGGR